jgi:membrane protein implicated in regulation of membrane protease activity
MDLIESNAWIFWLALVLVFVIIEVLTLHFTFLMLAVGSVGGLIADLLRAPFYAQVVIAGILSILLLFTVRPPLLRLLKRGGDKARSNVDALMGMPGTIVPDFNGNPTSVKLSNGETWTARVAGVSDAVLHEGESVIVTSIDGATAFVAPAERNIRG